MSMNIKIQVGISIDLGNHPSFPADIFSTSFLVFTFFDRKSSASPVTYAAVPISVDSILQSCKLNLDLGTLYSCVSMSNDSVCKLIVSRQLSHAKPALGSLVADSGEGADARY